jgi:type II secretory pathway component PulF
MTNFNFGLIFADFRSFYCKPCFTIDLACIMVGQFLTLLIDKNLPKVRKIFEKLMCRIPCIGLLDEKSCMKHFFAKLIMRFTYILVI